MKNPKIIAAVCIAAVLLLAIAGIIFIFQVPAQRAVYLAPESGAQLSTQDFKKHREIIVANSFDELKSSYREGMSIWIDKDAVDLLDAAWLHEAPQSRAPIVLVGYNNPLYAFREVLTGFGIEGPQVDWEQEAIEPGFSVWMRIDEASSFMQGYEQTPSVDGILAVTDMLMDGELP